MVGTGQFWVLASWRGCRLAGCLWYLLLAVADLVMALVLKVLYSKKLVVLHQAGQSVLLFPVTVLT